MFIAEIGINHKGSEEKAWSILKKLIQTNVDAITFQIPKPEFYAEVTKWGNKLSNEFYEKAINFVHKNKKLIGFAIADENMIQFLDDNGADFWKSASVYINDTTLQSKLQSTNKITFVSTGISDDEEIINVGETLKNIKFIHTQLTDKLEETNLKAIANIKKITDKDVAFGLHCSNVLALYLSVVFEPSDFFVYVKEDNKEEYPDDVHAILTEDLNDVVYTLNTIKKSLGSGKKEKVIQN